MTAKQDRVVWYSYDEEIGNFCYGGGNPMRPHRARLVFSLLQAYGLSKNMILSRPEPRNFDQLTEFHADGERHCLKQDTNVGGRRGSGR
jgi:histone deacetylase 1/2